MSFLHFRIIKSSQNANLGPFQRTFKSALRPQCIFNYSKLSTIPGRCDSTRTVKLVGEETGFAVSSDLYEDAQDTPGHTTKIRSGPDHLRGHQAVWLAYMVCFDLDIQ